MVGQIGLLIIRQFAFFGKNVKGGVSLMKKLSNSESLEDGVSFLDVSNTLDKCLGTVCAVVGAVEGSG